MTNHPIDDRSFRTSASASPSSISFLLPKAQSCTATAAFTTRVRQAVLLLGGAFRDQNHQLTVRRQLNSG